MKIDFKFLEKNGFLKESDYNELTSQWISLLNPIRIQNIRKYLRFAKLKYAVYLEEMNRFKKTFDSVEEEIDLLTAPIYFVTTFSSTLFPEFQDEYFAPLSFLTNKTFFTLKGLKILDITQYHSLTKADFDLSELVKERFAKSNKFKDVAEEIAVLNQFLVPFEIDSTFPMTIVMNINMIIK